MSRIHYFQRYSSPENVATNNTLLLFSRFYEEKPVYVQRLFESLFGDQFQIGLSFTQQEKVKNSIPDGKIVQSPLEIVLESKTFDWHYSSQLKAHLESFSKESHSNKYLVAIAKEFKEDRESKLREELGKDLFSKFKVITYQQISESARVAATGNITLEDIADEYESFCLSMDLFPMSKSWMKVFASGWTLKDNLEYNMYYRPLDKTMGLEDYQFLGLYDQKQIKAIGKIVGWLDANFVITNKETKDGYWEYQDSTLSTNEELKRKMEDMAYNSYYETFLSGWHRYFVVEKFYRTQINKTTPGGIMGPRVFDLARDFGKVVSKEMIQGFKTEEIAKTLNGLTWE